MSTTLPGQGQVDSRLLEMPDPNWSLMTILKNTWRAGGKIFATVPASIYFDTTWWSGGYDNEVHVRSLKDTSKRWGVGSTKRPHWTLHEVWTWSRDIKDRWKVLSMLYYILQLKAIKPTQDIERIDYWSTDYWQEQDPQGAEVLFRGKVIVQIIWVK